MNEKLPKYTITANPSIQLRGKVVALHRSCLFTTSPSTTSFPAVKQHPHQHRINHKEMNIQLPVPLRLHTPIT